MSLPIVPIVTLSPLDLIVPTVAGIGTSSALLSVNSSVLPFKVNADANTTRLELTIYNTVNGFNAFTVIEEGSPVVDLNQFTGSVPIQVNLQAVLVQLVGRNYNPQGAWTANTAFAAGYTFVDPNGNVQQCTTAGTSGATQPIWNTTEAGTTPDGTGITLATWTNVGVPQITPTIQFSLIGANSLLALSIGPPSGLRNYKGATSSKVEWAVPSYQGFIGVRLQISTDETGVTVPFAQYGNLVSDIERSENTVLSSDTSTSVQGNKTVVTQTQTTTPTNFSAIAIPQTDVNGAAEFYAVVSTVIQDPQTNVLFESQQNGPITCGYVDLTKVSPTDFLGLQRKEDIAARIIAGITRLYPELDLSPRSELRDLFIDPISIELSNMSVREWFARVSQSISAISQLDNASGNGISDPVNTSPQKQQIARAFGLSATDTQSLIDQQFDILGEQAGIERGGSTASVVELTFYTYIQPSAIMTIPVGATVATVPDSETPSLTFATTGSASINPSSLSSYYNEQEGWWAVTVPAQCTSPGSVGNVGAGAIRQVVANIPTGFNATNLVSAAFGLDEESNADYAAEIQDRLVTGVDSGTRNGYLVQALETPGVTNALVVAAGDEEMLRDWDPIQQKHVFGCVDIYTQGTNFSDQTANYVFSYPATSVEGNFAEYITAILLDPNLLKLQIQNYNALQYPLYTILEIRVVRGTDVRYLGVTNAQVNNATGIITLDPTDMAYITVGDGITQAIAPLVLNGVPANNQTLVGQLAAAASSYQFQVFARFQTGINYFPTLQPVLSVASVTGNGATGVVTPTQVQLVHTTDFLLTGGSNEANDEIIVAADVDNVEQKTLNFVTNGPTVITIDTGMDVPLDGNGNPLDVLSVRSADLSTLYERGVDYTIVATGDYHTYGLSLISTGGIVPTVNGTPVIVAYNQFSLFERPLFVEAELDTLNGSVPTTLQQLGFVDNVWLPLSYATVPILGSTTGATVPGTELLYDGVSLNANGSVATANANADGSVNVSTATTFSQGNVVYETSLISASIPYASRYIKVTWNNGVADVVAIEHEDFTLTVNSDGTATIARILTGRIPDGATVKVSYFVTEAFSIVSEYPAFVQQVLTAVDETKHAAADVLVKAMVDNAVDATLTITLASGATASTIDLQVRSAISIALDNAKRLMTQAEMIQQIMNVVGVSNVGIPLGKFAKADGSYDIGIVVPTQTVWTPLSQVAPFNKLTFGSNCYITSSAVLTDATIPSGGLPDSYVGLLQEGTPYTRSSSVQDFQAKSNGGTAFYIIGTNDQVNSTTPIPANFLGCILISIPANVPNPGLNSYFVTYQVFGEGGANDVPISSTEYLTPGVLTISYINAPTSQ